MKFILKLEPEYTGYRITQEEYNNTGSIVLHTFLIPLLSYTHGRKEAEDFFHKVRINIISKNWFDMVEYSSFTFNNRKKKCYAVFKLKKEINIKKYLGFDKR